MDFISILHILIVCTLTLLSITYGDDVLGEAMAKDGVYKAAVEKYIEEPWRQYRDEREREKKRNPTHWRDYYSKDLIEVPVVVHIVYKPEDDFIIGNEQIQSAFRVLNDGFFDINYWNKDELEVYANISGNFSMQFKLSSIKYVDATGKGPLNESWTEEELVSVSPNFDQQYYLHLYIAENVGAKGVSSFPFPLYSISDCMEDILGIDSVNNCFESSNPAIQAIYQPIYQGVLLFQQMGICDVGNDVDKCMDVMSAFPGVSTGALNESNCLPSVDMMLKYANDQMLEKAGISEICAECMDIATQFCDFMVGEKLKIDDTQGIMYGAEYFGAIEDDSRKQFNGGDQFVEDKLYSGTTVVHEVGHWVGLYHIFSDDDNCEKGDEVSDTLPQLHSWGSFPYAKCPKREWAKSCGSYDMYNNFMDYSDCVDLKYMFTQGQVDRGRFFFENEKGFRHSFVEYKSRIVTKFINSIYFIVENDLLMDKINPCHSGDVFIEQNINEGVDNKLNKKIYMCATYTMNPKVDMITELKFTNKPFAYGNLDCGGNGWERSDINLNYDRYSKNRGDEIYLCYKKEKYDRYSKTAITNVNILVTNLEHKSERLKSTQNWNIIPQNLNENSGSQTYLYLIYNTKRKSKSDTFAASIQPVVLDKPGSNTANMDDNDQLFGYDKLIYFLGLSSGLNVCAFSLIIFGVVYYVKNHFYVVYDKVEQNDKDEEV
eukprot:46643_1